LPAWDFHLLFFASFLAHAAKRHEAAVFQSNPVRDRLPATDGLTIPETLLATADEVIQ
jgi:hypothetical protein